MPEGRSDALYLHALAIAHEALDLPHHERDACLDARCGKDTPLRRETQWLIDASGDTSLDDIPQAITDASVELAANLRIDAVAPGRYRLLERLGEGGMGTVWLAEREVGDVRQRVALKRLRSGSGSLAQHARFREEQRILAALNHPNIAHLVDAGVDAAGEPFLAMEYIEGERMDRWSEAHGLDLRKRIKLFLKVCAAVSYAHERLVIHRDLKPANIVVDRSGEPKLLDFGIARLVDGDAIATIATIAMTPAYASPEQIEGAPLGTATDIYSLGVVLYELVTGTRPFAHITTDHERAVAVLAGNVTPPSQRHQRRASPGEMRAGIRSIPMDIDAIVLKALRREPGQRYASVRELADDLERFLAARPVHARRGRWSYHTQRFMQRNRWPLAVVATLVVVIAGFTWRTVLAEREARLQAQVANRTTEFLISAFALADPTQAERHDFSAREVLDRGRERVDEELAGQPQVRARLLEALGNAYRGINEGSTGAPLLEAAAKLYLEPAIWDPQAAARSLRAKAVSIRHVGGLTSEAEDAAQRAVDLLRDHAGNDQFALAEAYGTLARAMTLSMKDTHAPQIARQALALNEAADASPQVIAQSLLDLCAVLSTIGQHADAVGYCEQAREKFAAAGATRTNAYRLTLQELGIALSYSGNHDEALVVRRDRIALTRELFGENSPTLADEQISFVDALAEQGLFNEAAALLAAGTPVILRRHGVASTKYAKAVFIAGWLDVLRGEFDRAVPQLREALSIHEAVVDARDNNRVHVLRTSLAVALIESGHADADARSLLESVIAARSALTSEPYMLAYARLPMAHWHVIQGELDDADSLLDLVESAGNSVEPELHARAAALRSAIQRARADAPGALRLAQSAYDITLRDRGAQNPRTARYALGYATALRAAGETAKARQLERQYRPIIEQAYPATSAFRQALSGMSSRIIP